RLRGRTDPSKGLASRTPEEPVRPCAPAVARRSSTCLQPLPQVVDVTLVRSIATRVFAIACLDQLIPAVFGVGDLSGLRRVVVHVCEEGGDHRRDKRAEYVGWIDPAQ